MYFFNFFSLTILFATSCLVSANFHQIGRFRRQTEEDAAPPSGFDTDPEQPWSTEQPGQPGQPEQPEEPMQPGQPGQPGQQGEHGREMQCVLQCVQVFTQNLTAVFGDVHEMDEPEEIAKHADQFKFNSSMLTAICGSYDDYSSCKNLCGSMQNPAILQAVEMGFAGVKFVCVEHFDEFEQNAECFDKVQADEAGRQCSERCALMSSDNNTPKSEITAQSKNDGMTMAIHGLEMLCSFMPCTLNCTRPIYEDVCDSMDPFLLLQNYTRVAITGGVQSLSSANMRVPESCQYDMAQMMEPGEEYAETTEAPDVDETTVGVTAIPIAVTTDDDADVDNDIEVNNNQIGPQTGASTSGSERTSGRWLGAIVAVIIVRVVMV